MQNVLLHVRTAETVTDPGFRRRGEDSNAKVGAPAHYLANFFFRKLHENGRNWTKGRIPGANVNVTVHEINTPKLQKIYENCYCNEYYVNTR